MTIFEKDIASNQNSVTDNYELPVILNKNPHQKIWAIGGGKGGVGKSLLTANLSICLSLMGYKVTAIDLDLGGANLHTCLGVNIPSQTLSDYVNKKVKSLSEVMTSTGIPNLYMISGAQDDLGMANIKELHKNKILGSLHEISSDYILFDLGAGTAFNTLDFFINADQGLLMVLPEPTSIENTYRFLKSVFFRKLKLIYDLVEYYPLIDKTMNSKLTSDNLSPKQLLDKIAELNPVVGEKVFKEMSYFRPKLVINQVRTQADIDIGFSMKTICKRYFGLDVDFVGYLDYDPSVWQSVKKRRPLLMEFPSSKIVSNFDKIVHRLLNLA